MLEYLSFQSVNKLISDFSGDIILKIFYRTTSLTLMNMSVFSLTLLSLLACFSHGIQNKPYHIPVKYTTVGLYVLNILLF